MNNRIKELRKQKKITQDELAKAVEVTRQTIISLENGKYNASLQLAYKISRYFGTNIEDVFILIQVKNDKSKNVFSSIFTQHNFCYLENVDNQFAKMLLNEWKNKNPDYENVISGLMIIILTQITRLLLPKDFQEFTNKENLNDKRFAIIEQAFLYENDITLTKLSQMIGLCDRQTQRLLKKYYGKSFREIKKESGK